MLIKIGIRPAIAASTVLLGTWGSSVSPGNPFIVQVADSAKMDLMTLITAFAPKAFACVVFSCIIFVIITRLSKKVFQNDDKQTAVDETEEEFSVNYVYAVIPLVPIVLLLISSPAVMGDMITVFAGSYHAVFGFVIAVLCIASAIAFSIRVKKEDIGRYMSCQ